MASSPSTRLHVAASKDEVAKQVGPYVAAAAKAAIAARGRFMVAISGGSLPKLLAAGLLGDASIDWSKWHMFFADERVVPLDHADSNYAGVQAAFLSQVKVPPDQVYGIVYDGSVPAADAAAGVAEAYEATLRRVVGGGGGDAAGKETTPALDMILLGMGPDGHTCSLFPGHALLKEDKRLIAHITDSPKPPPCRITLTFPVIRAARQVAFVAAGGSKADNLPRALKADGGLPSSMARASDGTADFFVDKAAAARL